MAYCKRCGSRLYPVDKEVIEKYGVCSYCVTYDKQVKSYIKVKEEQRRS